MENWQVEHITKNLKELITLTTFNCIVKAELVGIGVLNQFTDVDRLDAKEKAEGKSAACACYYQTLMGRADAYKALYNVLVETNQSGAARLLVQVPPELFSKPLSYLGISMDVKDFQNVEFEVNSKVIKLCDFFPKASYKKLQCIFTESISEVKFYDCFVTKQKKFVLAKNTVPPKLSYYVPRFLSNRIKLDKSIFKINSDDKFVFKNNIPRHKLSEIVRPHYTETSTSQLIKMTSRFIYLDENKDWVELKKNANVPIHLINYESNRKQFILEDTSAASDILRRIGSQRDRVYMSEDDFIREKFEQDFSSSSVCICDTPGMGKTCLFANIARRMVEYFQGRIIIFIRLITFAKKFLLSYAKQNLSPETSLLLVFWCTDSEGKCSNLLLELVKAKLIQLEVFFDGFDEISGDMTVWVKTVFQSIISNFPNARLYISSRPHMRQELEQSLGVVAYDILPFSRENQVEFLVKYWDKNELNCSLVSLQTYANSFLEAVHNSLTKNDKEITGIPLLCHLIAEVYSDESALHAIQRKNFLNVPFKLSGMYKQFIEKKINLVTVHRKILLYYLLKSAHIWHALQLIFPTTYFHGDVQFRNIKCLLSSPDILRVGILEKHFKTTLEFIHRTFAEYLVAEYISTKIQDREMCTSEKNKCEIKLMLQELLRCQSTTYNYGNDHDYSFLNPVIVTFLNCALCEVKVSEELQILVSKILSSISKGKLIEVMCSCCEHNLLNIFNLLCEALSKCEKTWILECFTADNSYQLLRTCIEKSTSQIFHACMQLLTNVLQFNVTQINTFNKYSTTMILAVKAANFEAVEYFVDKVSLKAQHILRICVLGDSIENRKSILHLLLDKDPTLIYETPHLLVTPYINIELTLFKILVESGAHLTAVDEHGWNCAMNATLHMSPLDYHELVRFIIMDCKAEYLFLKNDKQEDPLPRITERIKLLPETMELLLNIPGIDIGMKVKWEESLLFHAVLADDLNELQQLVNRGVNYNARNLVNATLLHVATKHGGVEMVRYLLSLKLDPNSPDETTWTPLKYAAFYGRLSVLEAIVVNGGNVQAKYKHGQTILHFLVENNGSKCCEVIKYLTKMGAKINEPDNRGNTPLHYCRESKKVKELLIEMGADICAINENGETPTQFSPKLWK